MESLYDDIRKALQQNHQYVKTLEKFGQLDTNEKRVEYVFNLSVVQNHIKLDKLRVNNKCSEEASVMRSKGNECFQKKDYEASLEWYSKSVLKSPVSDIQCFSNSSPQKTSSRELSLAYANRSAALFHLNDLTACLCDIEKAFSCGYSEENHYKLFERKGKCFSTLKSYESAESSFKAALESLKYAKLSEEKHVVISKNLSKLLNESIKQKGEIPQDVKTTMLDEVNHFHNIVPEISEKSRNEVFLSAASSIGFSENTEKGRCLVATQDLKVGEVLAIERPYTSVNLANRERLYCHHCCRRVNSPIPCRQCSDIVYCSSDCQNQSWQLYHHVECPILKHIHSLNSKLGHLALRMVIKAGREWLLKQREEFCEGDTNDLGYNKDGRYDSGDYLAVHNLVNHVGQRTPEDLFKRALQAVYLLKCIELTPFFDADIIEGMETLDLTHDKKFYIGGHILRHIQMLPCNAHEVSELQWKPGDSTITNTVEIGSGIYALLSLINHSCDPSVVRHCYGNVCVVRTIKRIRKGEEILDNYGTLYPLTCRSERRAKLRPQYYFECNCEACQIDWPLYYDIPEDTPIFRCSKCDGPVFIPSDGNISNTVCSSCHGKQELSATVVKLRDSSQQFWDALEEVLSGQDIHKALPCLLEHLDFLSQHICLPWRDFNNCQEAIKQCFAIQANSFII